MYNVVACKSKPDKSHAVVEKTRDATVNFDPYVSNMPNSTVVVYAITRMLVKFEVYRRITDTYRNHLEPRLMTLNDLELRTLFQGHYLLHRARMFHFFIMRSESLNTFSDKRL